MALQARYEGRQTDVNKDIPRGRLPAAIGAPLRSPSCPCAQTRLSRRWRPRSPLCSGAHSAEGGHGDKKNLATERIARVGFEIEGAPRAGSASSYLSQEARGTWEISVERLLGEIDSHKPRGHGAGTGAHVATDMVHNAPRLRSPPSEFARLRSGQTSSANLAGAYSYRWRDLPELLRQAQPLLGQVRSIIEARRDVFSR